MEAASPRGDEVSAHIARAAARLFAAKGFDATSVREIVEAAGVTKPTLYYHFGSKEGLAEALVTVPIGELVEKLRAIVQGPGEPFDKLATVAEAHYEFGRDDPDRMRFLFGLAFAPVGTGLSQEIDRFGDRMHKLGEEMMRLEVAAVAEMAAAGHVAADRVADCAQAFHGMMMVHLIGFLFKCKPLEPGRGRTMVADLIWGFGEARSRSEG